MTLLGVGWHGLDDGGKKSQEEDEERGGGGENTEVEKEKKRRPWPWEGYRLRKSRCNTEEDQDDKEVKKKERNGLLSIKSTRLQLQFMTEWVNQSNYPMLHIWRWFNWSILHTVYFLRIENLHNEFNFKRFNYQFYQKYRTKIWMISLSTILVYPLSHYSPDWSVDKSNRINKNTPALMYIGHLDYEYIMLKEG